MACRSTKVMKSDVSPCSLAMTNEWAGMRTDPDDEYKFGPIKERDFILLLRPVFFLGR